MTYDSGTYLKTFYIDGALIEQWYLRDFKGPNLKGISLNPNVLPGFVLDSKLAIGYYCSKSNTASSAFDYSTAPEHFHWSFG